MIPEALRVHPAVRPPAVQHRNGRAIRDSRGAGDEVSHLLAPNALPLNDLERWGPSAPSPWSEAPPLALLFGG